MSSVERETIEREIIRRLGLENDFFTRNPAIFGHDGKKLIIGFSNWKLIMTKKEHEKLYKFLHWGCGSCCGFGGHVEYEEGGFTAIEGVPCACHADSWSWVAVVPWE